jgi:hypothetical protein
MRRLIDNIGLAPTMWPFRTPLMPLILAAVLLAPAGASAKLCGDDVGGQDVPCACGDTVVSDVRLDADPVASTVCPADALIVRAPDAADSLSIDLGGQTLRGSGAGVGLWVLHGGPGGARIVSTGGSATIQGFRDGVVAHGPPSIALLEHVIVRDSGRDGVRLFDVNGATVRNAEVFDSGRDGFTVGGKDYVMTSTRAVNSTRHGYHLMGGGARIGLMGAGNVAEGSGKRGFALMGMGHRLLECVATGSGLDGVRLAGAGYEIMDCQAWDNGRDGISGRGMGWTLTGNQANDNEQNGIVVLGSDMTDGGGNTGTGNQGLHQRSPVAQCEIANTPCVP